MDPVTVGQRCDLRNQGRRAPVCDWVAKPRDAANRPRRGYTDTSPAHDAPTPRLVATRGRYFFSVGSVPSSGAPVPDEPTNSVRPSAYCITRALARLATPFAIYPCTVISVPTLM